VTLTTTLAYKKISCVVDPLLKANVADVSEKSGAAGKEG